MAKKVYHNNSNSTFQDDTKSQAFVEVTGTIYENEAQTRRREIRENIGNDEELREVNPFAIEDPWANSKEDVSFGEKLADDAEQKLEYTARVGARKYDKQVRKSIEFEEVKDKMSDIAKSTSSKKDDKFVKHFSEDDKDFEDAKYDDGVSAETLSKRYIPESFEKVAKKAEEESQKKDSEKDAGYTPKAFRKYGIDD